MKLLVITIMMLLMSACPDPAPAIKQTKSNNPRISIDFLFKKDGYKIHRGAFKRLKEEIKKYE